LHRLETIEDMATKGRRKLLLFLHDFI